LQRKTKTTIPEHVSLEQAFDCYYPAVFRYFRFRGADKDTANDLASSTFERAFKNLSHFDPHKAQIQTWLFSIAHNLGVNHWKAEKQTVPLDDELPIPDDPPVEQSIILNQDKERILQALNSLDDRSRETLALKFGGLLTNRQIAELNHLSESNVGIILYRSIIKIRAMLANETTETSHDR
jgi:RNA polymerase sigma-70 factor (ECF subfamily)